MKGIDNRITGRLKRLLKLNHIKEIHIWAELSKNKKEYSKYSDKPSIIKKVLFITNKCLYNTESVEEECIYLNRIKDLCIEFSDPNKIEFNLYTNIEIIYSNNETRKINLLELSQLMSAIVTTGERMNASFSSNQRVEKDKEAIFMNELTYK